MFMKAVRVLAENGAKLVMFGRNLTGPYIMLYQNLTQKQQLKIHPQHLQMLQLLHLNTVELEQRIQNELEENKNLTQNEEWK